MKTLPNHRLLASAFTALLVAMLLAQVAYTSTNPAAFQYIKGEIESVDRATARGGEFALFNSKSEVRLSRVLTPGKAYGFYRTYGDKANDFKTLHVRLGEETFEVDDDDYTIRADLR